MPRWQVALRTCEVLTYDERHRPRDVSFEADVIFKAVRYTLRHTYEEPHRISGQYLEGDFRDFAGEWRMEGSPDHDTTVTFKVGIDPGAWVPGHIARTLNRRILRESVERLKTEVEQRAQGVERERASR